MTILTEMFQKSRMEDYNGLTGFESRFTLWYVTQKPGEVSTKKKLKIDC
jgi:hypothetical protein